MIIEKEHKNSQMRLEYSREQLKGFRVYRRGYNKSGMKSVIPQKVKMELGEVYQIFVDFLELLLFSVDEEDKLYLSNSMIQKKGELFFFYCSGTQCPGGFRPIQKRFWPQEVSFLWRDFMQIHISDLSSQKNEMIYKEWSNWMENTFHKQFNCTKYQQHPKDGLIELMTQTEELMVGREFSLRVRLNDYLLSPRLSHHQKLDQLFQPIKQQKRPSQPQTRDIFQLKRKKFKYLKRQIRHLIRHLADEQLIDQQNLSDSITQKSFQIQPSHKQIYEQIFNFRIKIHPEAQMGQNQTHYKNVLSQGKKWINIIIVLQMHHCQIVLTVKTMTLWKIYSQDLVGLKEGLEKGRIENMKWLLEKEIDGRLFDLLRVEMQAGNAEEESAIGMVEEIKLTSKMRVCLLVLGCIDRQLIYWLIWQPYLVATTKIWMNQPITKALILPSNMDETIRCSLLFLHTVIKYFLQSLPSS